MQYGKLSVDSLPLNSPGNAFLTVHDAAPSWSFSLLHKEMEEVEVLSINLLYLIQIA
jgi:hypothetical protein